MHFDAFWQVDRNTLANERVKYRLRHFMTSRSLASPC